MMLTALEIKNAKKGMHCDGNGLYLRVQASGAKSWIFRFQLNGKRREMGIGTLADKSAPDARTEAGNLSSIVRSGIDPIEDRHLKITQAAEDARVAKAKGKTFEIIATEYIVSHRAAWKNNKHAAQWTSTLKKYVYPIIGHMPICDVSTEDVLRILKPIWTNKTETATRVRSRIELILSYGKALNLREGENPAIWRGHLDALLPKPTKIKTVRHYPALPYSKAASFMAKLRTIKGSSARALEFAVLTAARSGEVRLASWQEIDLDAKLWIIPAQRMKAQREHWIPLSNQAILLLMALPRIEDNFYLFPGVRNGNPLSDMSLSAIVRGLNNTKGVSFPEWVDSNGIGVVPHGFRSTFRDWAAEVGEFPREIAEHALAHSLPNKVEASYHRGTMIERRRPMMQQWADFLDDHKETEATTQGSHNGT